MQHRKREHINYVSECRENENGCCSFSGQDCWFRHSDKISKNYDEVSGFKNSGLKNANIKKIKLIISDHILIGFKFMSGQRPMIKNTIKNRIPKLLLLFLDFINC